MKEKDAIETFLKRSRSPRLTINKLCKWEEKLTLKENARNLELTVESTRAFSVRFGLKFKRIRNAGKTLPQLKTDAYLELRKIGWSFEDIAKTFDRTKQSVEEVLRRRD